MSGWRIWKSVTEVCLRLQTSCVVFWNVSRMFWNTRCLHLPTRWAAIRWILKLWDMSSIWRPVWQMRLPIRRGRYRELRILKSAGTTINRSWDCSWIRINWPSMLWRRQRLDRHCVIVFMVIGTVNSKRTERSMTLLSVLRRNSVLPLLNWRIYWLRTVRDRRYVWRNWVRSGNIILRLILREKVNSVCWKFPLLLLPVLLWVRLLCRLRRW